MATSTTRTNKPINPRGNDQSPKGYNRAALYSGKALDFDGVNDYVKTPNMALQSTNVWTYSANVKIDTGGILARYIFDTRASEAAGQGAHFTSTAQLQIFQVGDSSRKSNFIFERNQWYKIDITSDASNVKLYINGVLSQSFAAFNVVSVLGDLTIGARFTNNYSLVGDMGGFKAFDVALTAAQVADLYNNPEKVVPTGVDNTALKLWLPMMEGAGTTAYDGSGNGNHGTISGATYVNGIGAPVAQSAVMDWNKATNKVTNSYDISGILNTTTGVTFNYAEAPDGTQTATRFVAGFDFNIGNVGVDGDTRSLWIRATSGSGDVMVGARYTATYDLITLTEEWQRVERPVVIGQSGEPLFYLVDFRHGGTTITDVLVWCPQVNVGATADPTLLTTGTAQTSPVLLPQGLTSGRDITGVNLFENVRKQGALNLDGNSWAEVHDNASLDITTAITLEAWVYWDLNGPAAGGIMSKWFPSNWGFLFFTNAATLTFYISNVYPATASVAHTFTANGWYHLVGTDDGTTIRLYIDGVEVGSTSSLGSIVDTGRELEIGRYNDSINNTYQDSIAQPRIYNRALTAEEVQRSYDSGKNIYTNS